MELRKIPMSRLLKRREIFSIVDDEFHKSGWLDVTVLLASESTIDDLYSDGTVPKQTLDHIVERLQQLTEE